MQNFLIFTVNLLVTATLVSSNFQPPLQNFGTKDEKLKAQKQQRFPPCKSCTIFVESFKKVSWRIFKKKFLSYQIHFQGLEKTQRGKHGGGDADWEEKKLGSYKTSEVRLVEIQEQLCTDITRGEQQCQNLAEEHENEIETWWKQQEEFPGK